MVVCHLPYGPTTFFGLSNVVCRHDIGDKREVGTVSGAYPHLVFDGFSGKLGERVKCVLRHLFPAVQQEEAAKGRVMTFANHGRDDLLAFRHHAYAKGKEGHGKDGVELTEKGPRFEARVYQIRLGTLTDKHSENEYVLRAYINSSKKQRLDDGGDS